MNTNFVIKLGVDWTRVLTYKQSNGTAVNLTGYTARMQVRENVSSPTKILDLTTENGSIAIDGSTGTITLALTHAQLSEGLPALQFSHSSETLYENLDSGQKLTGVGKVAVYDLDIISPGGTTITKLLTGKVVFEPSVSR